MADRETRQTASELPWAFVFDPLSNARALGEVQRRGLRAASDLVDRVLGSLTASADDDHAVVATTAETPHRSGDSDRATRVDGDVPAMLVELALRTLSALATLGNGHKPLDDAVRLVPAGEEPSERSAREVTVRLRLDPASPPGVYRGRLQASGENDVTIDVECRLDR
jgi:hypothetical protein